jgi:deoxycytidylate deaminase
MKEKFIDAHMKASEVYAQLSSAKRLQVGCVVVKDNTIIGIGYNGMPSGWDNDCEEKTYIHIDEKYEFLDHKILGEVSGYDLVFLYGMRECRALI